MSGQRGTNGKGGVPATSSSTSSSSSSSSSTSTSSRGGVGGGGGGTSRFEPKVGLFEPKIGGIGRGGITIKAETASSGYTSLPSSSSSSSSSATTTTSTTTGGESKSISASLRQAEERSKHFHHNNQSGTGQRGRGGPSFNPKVSDRGRGGAHSNNRGAGGALSRGAGGHSTQVSFSGTNVAGTKPKSGAISFMRDLKPSSSSSGSSSLLGDDHHLLDDENVEHETEGGAGGLMDEEYFEYDYYESESSGSDDEANRTTSKLRHPMRTADRKMALDPHGPLQLPWSNPRQKPSSSSSSSKKIIQDEEGPPMDSDCAIVGLNKPRPESLYLFQLPLLLPLSSGGQLSDVPEGPCGQLMIYKSGKMKMRFGDRLFDVMPGTKREVAQDLAVVKHSEQKFQIMGQIEPHPLIVVPDFDELLS